jgi:hypothetical protein
VTAGNTLAATQIAYYWTIANAFNESTVNSLPIIQPGGVAANVSYYIYNVFAHCVWLNPREELNNSMKSKLESGSGVRLYFDTFRNHQRQIANAFAGEQTVLWQERVASLKGILLAMVNQGDYNSYGREIRFNHNNMTKYRWRIGDTFIPQTDVICDSGGIEPYVELMRFFGADGNIEVDNLIRYDNYRPDAICMVNNKNFFVRNCPTRGVGHSDRFIVGLNLENSLGQLSGMDTLRMNADVEFRYTLAAGDPVGLVTRQNWIPVVPECTTTVNPTAAALPNNNFSTLSYYASGVSTCQPSGGPIAENYIIMPQCADGSALSSADANALGNGGWGNQWNLAPLLLPAGIEGYSGLQLLQPNDANYVAIQSGKIASGFNFPGAGPNPLNAANANISQQASNWATLYTPCVVPTYYTWYAFTHFDAVLIFKTFGTVVATTDIFFT